MIARKGDYVLDFLYRQLGVDDDQIEAQFYQLNPHVYHNRFVSDTEVTLPDVMPPAKKGIKRLWN